MDKYERIKTEYMLFEADTLPEDFDDAKECLNVYIEDMDDSLKGIRRSVRENTFEICINGIRNFVNLILDYVPEEKEWYIADNEVLERHRVVAVRYREMFSLIKDSMTDSNYQELTKLAEFTHNSYMSNYHYLESVRDSIEYSARGITYYGGGDDTLSEYSMFFNETMARIVGEKNKVFEKK